MRGSPFKTTEDLLAAFREAGVRHNVKWLIRQEKKGILRCPRDPATDWRRFTDGQIEEIVSAFSPGGAGSWFAKEVDGPRRYNYREKRETARRSPEENFLYDEGPRTGSF